MPDPVEAGQTSVLDADVQIGGDPAPATDATNKAPNDAAKPDETVEDTGGALSFGDDDLEDDAQPARSEADDETPEPETVESAADARRKFMEEFRAAQSPQKPETPAAKAPESGGETASETPAPAAFDVAAFNKTFGDEFGDDAVKAIEPLTKIVQLLAEQAAAATKTRDAETQTQQVYAVHRYMDSIAADGLEQHIGNGSKARLTPEQVAAREDLYEIASVTAKQAKDRGKPISDADAFAKAARVLFDVGIKTTRATDADDVRKTLERRRDARTIRPRSSTPARVANHITDDSWDADDPDVARMRKAASEYASKNGLSLND